jgi:hypothetical protein
MVAAIYADSSALYWRTRPGMKNASMIAMRKGIPVTEKMA